MEKGSMKKVPRHGSSFHPKKKHNSMSHMPTLKPNQPDQPASIYRNKPNEPGGVDLGGYEDPITNSGGGPSYDTDNFTNGQDKHGERPTGRGGGRFIIRKLWDVCCNETEQEIKELDTLLTKLGLPSVNYTKSKTYDINDYYYAPDLSTCKSKDFLDFYVFPYLLPAIQALIRFARVNRVFQCRFCTFNALDYIVEYLYNNNPRYPERLQNPTPIFEIPFAKAWLADHPRKPAPKWMLMNSEEAAIIIQRAIRGYMVRCRPAVQEMRQFWKDFRKDLEEERTLYGRNLPNYTSSIMFSPYYEELRGEFESTSGSPDSSPRKLHSDQCVYCRAFRDYLHSLPEVTQTTLELGTSVANAAIGSNQGSAKAKNSNVGNDGGSGIVKVSMTDTPATTTENDETGSKNSKNSLRSQQEAALLASGKGHRSVAQKKSISSALNRDKDKINKLLSKAGTPRNPNTN